MNKLFSISWRSIFLFFFALSMAWTVNAQPSGIAKVKNGRFDVDGKPYHFVGVNFWYGPLLASSTEYGNRERLIKELDEMKRLGITNLRVLVGSDGDETAGLQPTLQQAPGVYNDAVLDGLDYFLAELGKRNMKAVLFFNNAWNWSGGYGQYVQWVNSANERNQDAEDSQGYGFVGRARFNQGAFLQSQEARKLFDTYVTDIITRTNRYTGLKYIDDPAIFSWQLCNEPRPFGKNNWDAYIDWIESSAKLIRSLDPNHMISTGSEGEMGTDNDMELWRKSQEIPEISYANIHLWPNNWGWLRGETEIANLENSKNNAKDYIEKHAVLARKMNKPLVMEEFGYPRDGKNSFKPATPVVYRDKFFEYIFTLIKQYVANDDVFVGCNIWAWGGFAKVPDEPRPWRRGDDYSGDPGTEVLGLNAVFAPDKSTTKLIKKTNSKIK